MIFVMTNNNKNLRKFRVFLKNSNKIKIKKTKRNFKKKFPNSSKQLDYIQNRYILKKLLSLLIKKGKKIKAYHLLFKTFIFIKLITGQNPIFFILASIKSVKPYVKTIKVRKGGRVYEVPVPLNKKKQLFLTLS